MRLIKRYPNRKLYDTTTKRYVTLKELARLVQNGETIKVVDFRNGQDITSKVLAQVLVVEEKTRGIHVAVSKVRELLRAGEGILQTHVQKLSSEAERTVSRPFLEVKQVLDAVTRSFEDFQKSWEARLEDVMALIKQSSSLREELEGLKRKVTALEERIKQLEDSRGGKDEC